MSDANPPAVLEYHLFAATPDGANWTVSNPTTPSYKLSTSETLPGVEDAVGTVDIAEIVAGGLTMDSKVPALGARGPQSRRRHGQQLQAANIGEQGPWDSSPGRVKVHRPVGL